MPQEVKRSIVDVNTLLFDEARIKSSSFRSFSK